MAQSVTIKDHLRESRLFLNRTIVALVVVGALALALLVRLILLQVVNHDHFSTLSLENSVRIEPLAPTRGLIYDRNGVLLADNQPSYTLELVPEKVGDLDETIARLREILTIEEEDIARFQRLRRRRLRFHAVPLRHRLNEEEVSRFAVQRHDFPGVDIQARLYRYYPIEDLTSHVMGYVGRIDDDDLRRLDNSSYSGTTHVGKVGVERTYEDELHGKVGFRRVETNAEGRVIRVLERTAPVPGDDLVLNLDVRVQQEAYDALGEYNGSVVVLDPRDGAVLALASKPGYDPNLFVNGISTRDYRALNDSPDKPLFNRAIRGQYPPGSTLKPFVGLAGLEYQLTDLEHQAYCPGFFRLPGKAHRYRDWKKVGHGHMDMMAAITESCDVYFYQLALALGIDRMHAYLARFRFGTRTGIDITGELPGLLPSREWKRRAREEPWYPGETLITGIGQGYNLATPVQLATATAMLARQGGVVVPRIVRQMQNAAGEFSEPDPGPDRYPVEPVREENWELIVDSMANVVHGRRGTARKVGNGAPYSFAGKTGTAQVYTIKQDAEYDKDNVPEELRDHALFVSFAPLEEPRVAVAVVVEHGGSGSSVAAPIARRVMDRQLLGRVVQ
jgi:penicillin-binding protein 2